jgi:hypothetical protein
MRLNERAVASMLLERSSTSASIASTLSRLPSPYRLKVTSFARCSRHCRR